MCFRGCLHPVNHRARFFLSVTSPSLSLSFCLNFCNVLSQPRFPRTSPHSSHAIVHAFVPSVARPCHQPLLRIDSNIEDADEDTSANPEHNICGAMHNPPGSSCAKHRDGLGDMDGQAERIECGLFSLCRPPEIGRRGMCSSNSLIKKYLEQESIYSGHTIRVFLRLSHYLALKRFGDKT